MGTFTVFQNGKEVGFDKATINSSDVVFENGKNFVAVVSMFCGNEEVYIHFNVLEDFFGFCEKHNVEVVDSRKKEEAVK
jgi:hypothetical protein